MEELEMKPKKKAEKSASKKIEDNKDTKLKTGGNMTDTSGNNEHFKNIKDMKLIAAIAETILAVPFLGGFLIISTAWTALGIMFLFHVALIVYISKNEHLNIPRTGNIVGVVISLAAFIPFVGFIGHIVTAVMLWKEVDELSKRK